MNLSQAIRKASHNLSHLENPTLETEVLLAALLKKNRTWLKTHPEFELSPAQQLEFESWVDLRAKHTPAAYIIGTVEWNNLALYVTPDTLIPRDETETLCHHLKAQQNVEPKTILDVGTGSGCLACWSKTTFSKAAVTAVDISEAALTVARKNAEHLKLQIDFKHSDLLGALKPNTHFDVVIANLPYVPASVEVTAEVRAEPYNAIFSADDGLHHIKRFATELKTKSITFNQLWLEFLPTQAPEIKQIFGSYKVEFFTDIGGELFFACIKK